MLSLTNEASVLMPIRDGAATLDRALESIQKQTIWGSVPIELILIDDGSQDSTLQILYRWKQIMPSIHVFQTHGVGISRALNLGLSHCKGEWIIRMDCDDVCHPERFQCQFELATKSLNAGLITCSVESELLPPSATPLSSFDVAVENAEAPVNLLNQSGMIQHMNWANDQKTHEEMKLALWIDSPAPHPTWFVRNKVFKEVGDYLYDPFTSIPEDYEWLHRFYSNKNWKSYKVAGKPLLTWCDSPQRLTRTNDAYSEFAFNKVKAKYLKAYFEKNSIRDFVIFALGPKTKAFLPELISLNLAPRAFVDVSPKKVGKSYCGIEVWDLATYENERRQKPNLFVLISLGIPSARQECEFLCEKMNLIRGTHFLSL